MFCSTGCGTGVLSTGKYGIKYLSCDKCPGFNVGISCIVKITLAFQSNPWATKASEPKPSAIAGYTVIPSIIALCPCKPQNANSATGQPSSRNLNNKSFVKVP